MKYHTVLFDLDGTLLDTLTDLAGSVNHALRSNGLSERSAREVRAFLGNGIRDLVQQSVGTNCPLALFEAVFEDFRAHYRLHSLDATAPYAGIMPLLDQLQGLGVRMGIISNKVDEAVQGLHARFFGQAIELAVGERAGIPKKPAPDAVLHAMQALKADPATTLYVGDSEVDFATAQAAGIDCALVLWGFRDDEQLRPLGATHYVEQPAELLKIVES